ncbi:SOS response-associated peptidase [Chelatococcus composti]|jgi:Uncharacterized conserved protein|uniref:Abasic site processing protein n=1 Tax=Chelatococcus composti TaxID=1743235 RepID=A0A841K7N3_9HYPH|nr:SOS response-associated peptidase [Chelatococcus composti]MBB6168471.1 putative SOS response-associated peptidase YedK [Chelatococcus composti]MBS7736449.1 SOS response-associated peptidase [Chelatococcus composti]PZN43402.1 MAG: DUF159 family protein [Pseudomonadota bacterium]GGG40355.1 DUF159 family protein [Chelatococcus composti]
MCGRFALTLLPELVRAECGYEEEVSFPPRYNIAPTQPIGVVTADTAGRRHFALMRWGFIPAWAKDPAAMPLLFNARGETLVQKAAFRTAARHRRCLVPASAFYEWRRDGTKTTPFMIERADGGLMLFAGVWETYASPNGSEIDTVAIVTTSANGALASLHPRMPVIIAANDAGLWLDCSQPGLEALGLVRPAPDDLLTMRPVSANLNDARRDDATVQQPAAGEPPTAARGQQKGGRKRPPDTQLSLFGDGG